MPTPPAPPPAPPTASAEAPFGGLAPTVTLEDVELCRVGQWDASTGGVRITADVLAQLAEASRDADADHVPVHAGHVDPRFPALSDGEPAMGWVTNVRVAGDRLIGDLANIPARLAAIIPKAYRRRSIEIAANVARPDGTVRPYALHGLGLLGVQMPAVKGLADVVGRYSAPEPTTEGLVWLLSDEGDVPPPATSGRHDDTTSSPVAVRNTPPPKERPVPRIPDDRLRQLAGLAADADVSRLQAELIGTYEAGDPTPTDVTATPTGAPAAAPAATTPGANIPTPTVAGDTATPVLAGVGAGAASLSAADGSVTLSAGQWAGIESLIRDQHTTRVEGTLAAALSAGRIAPAEAGGWRSHLSADLERTTALLELLPAGRVPVTELGSTGHANLSAHTAAGEAELLSFEASLGLDLPGRTPTPTPTTQGA